MSLPFLCHLSPELLCLRVEDIAKSVAQQVEGQYAHEDRYPGNYRQVAGRVEIGASIVDHCAPLGGRRLSTQSQETEGSCSQDRGCQAQGGIDEDRRDDVRQDGAKKNPARGTAEGDGGRYVLLLPDCEH